MCNGIEYSDTIDVCKYTVIYLVIHTYIHAFIYLSTHTFTHLFIHSLDHSLSRAFIHLTQSCINPNHTHSFILITFHLTSSHHHITSHHSSTNLSSKCFCRSNCIFSTRIQIDSKSGWSSNQRSYCIDNWNARYWHLFSYLHSSMNIFRLTRLWYRQKCTWFLW